MLDPPWKSTPLPEALDPLIGAIFPPPDSQPHRPDWPVDRENCIALFGTACQFLQFLQDEGFSNSFPPTLGGIVNLLTLPKEQLCKFFAQAERNPSESPTANFLKPNIKAILEFDPEPRDRVFELVSWLLRNYEITQNDAIPGGWRFTPLPDDIHLLFDVLLPPNDTPDFPDNWPEEREKCAFVITLIASILKMQISPSQFQRTYGGICELLTLPTQRTYEWLQGLADMSCASPAEKTLSDGARRLIALNDRTALDGLLTLISLLTRQFIESQDQPRTR
jgi:hypothetical protein